MELEDITIPRLDIVQAMSPCRKKTDSAYIEGAEEGMLYNNVTRELYEEGVYVVPLVFKKEYIIWKDREAGGGFRGVFDNAQAAKDTILELITNGDTGPFEAVDTAQHFCLLIEFNNDQTVKSVNEIAISMSKSKMKVSRKWNSIIRILGGDRFSRIYKVIAVEDKSDKGEYFNFKIENHGFPSQQVYEKAEAIYTEISKGERDVVINQDVDETETEIVSGEEAF